MKTINDYLNENPLDENEEFFLRKGVEFAQRWILCSEQLPEIKDKSYQILVKTPPTPSGTVMHRVIAIFFFESQRTIEMKLNKYTHWRKINIE